MVSDTDKKNENCGFVFVLAHFLCQLCSIYAGVVRDRVTEEGPELHRKSTINRSYGETEPLVHPAKKSYT